MYQLVRGKLIKDINFKLERATSGKYIHKMVCQNIFTFDTETTSDYVDEDGNVFMFDYDEPSRCQKALKHSVCYLWQFGIDEDTRYIGRELTDFCDLLYELKQYVSEFAVKICYVHNFSFDMNFLSNVIAFSDVFARTPRHPMCAYSRQFGIEFKCSYVLTNLKLETWAKALKLPVQKQTGLLDYKVLRTPKTPLTDDELKYAIADLDVIYYGIKVYREQYGGMHNIPLTQTGKVRLVCKDALKSDGFYCDKVTKLMPQTLDEYIAQAHAFLGGTVLCNWLFKNRTIHNVLCFDIASSYPWVLINNRYPMTVFLKVPRGKEKQFMYNEKYCYIIHFSVGRFESVYNCHFMSKSKALHIKNAVCDNGRICSADSGEFILVNTDFELFLKCYGLKFEDINIITFEYSRTGYLNDNFRRLVISLYKDKTTLKDVEGQEQLYQNKKEQINSMYGDFVTKIFSDEIKYKQNNDEEWQRVALDETSFNKALARLNRKRYQNYKAFIQGVFVTAWARKRIWDAIIQEFDDDLVYTDTDSLKIADEDGTNYQRIMSYFERENKIVLSRHEQIAKDLKIDINDLSPVDIHGHKHPIGVFEQESTCKSFRSLGCKQYIAEYEDGKKKLTCAGVSKLAVQCFDTVDDFTINKRLTEKELLNCTDGKGHTAEKLTPYYNNQYPTVHYPDGYTCTYRSGVCLMPTTFNLSITPSDLYLLYTDVKQRLNQKYYESEVHL